MYETTGGYIRPSRLSPYFVQNQGKRVRNEEGIFELGVKSRVGVYKESEDVLERKINKTCGKSRRMRGEEVYRSGGG